MPTFGLNGAVNTTEYARLAGLYGADYGVEGPGDWQVTPVAGADRTVRIAAGTGYGRGVLDEDTPETTIEGDLVGSGTRWDTVVRRRTWGNPGSSEFDILPGTSTKAISADRLTTVGIEDDQPVALVQFSSSNPMPVSVVDLRCWRGNAGVVAATPEALAYLDRLGSHVHVESTGEDFVRIRDAQQNPIWARPGQSWAPLHAAVPPAGVTTTGTFGIGEAVTVPAATRDRVIDIDFGALASAMSASAADVVLRRGTTDLRRIKLREANDSGSARYSDILAAGASTSYQIVVTVSGSVTISGDGRYTYMTISPRAL